MVSAGDDGPRLADAGTAKRALRAEVLARRRELTAAELEATALGLRDTALSLDVVRRAETVALYASTGSEPGTGPLIAALHERGTRILLPVLRPDLDLDWAAHTGTVVPGPRGTSEPDGRRLGRAALAEADAVLVPALAVDRRGNRLGRGGGSYDRALAHRRAGVVVSALVYDEEILAAVPAERHDVGVAYALTSTRSHKLWMTPC